MKWKLCFLSILLSCALVGCESKSQNDKFNNVTGNEQTSKAPDSEMIINTLEPTKEIVLEEKEIVFANHPLVYTELSMYLEGFKFNVLESVYEPQTSETLYTFCIDFENFLSSKYENPEGYPIRKGDDTTEEWLIKKNDFWMKEVLKIIEDTDLILLSDYPYCHYNQEPLTHPYHRQQTLRVGLCAVVGTLDEIKELFDRTASFEGVCLRVRSAPRPDLLEKMKEAGWNGFYPMEWFEQNEEKIRQLIGNENQVTMKLNFETVENE